jgi:hypothetical protein
MRESPYEGWEGLEADERIAELGGTLVDTATRATSLREALIRVSAASRTAQDEAGQADRTMAESEARAVVREMVPLVTALEALNQQLDGFRDRLGPSRRRLLPLASEGEPDLTALAHSGWRSFGAARRLVSQLRLGRHTHVLLPDRALTDCDLGLVLRPFLALYAGTARLHGPVSAPPQYCDGRHRQVQCHPADSHVLPFRRPRRPRRQVRRTAGPPSHQPNEARVDAEPVGSGCASRHLPPEGCLRFRMDRNSRSTSSSFAF